MKKMYEIDKRKKSKVHLEMDKITKRDGIIDKNSIVREAQKKGTALHTDFNKRGLFDAKKAMNFAQITYAGILLRQYKVWVSVEDREPVKVRAYVSLTTDRNSGGGYRPTIEVMKNNKKRNNLLQDALSELKNFERKYSILSELAPVFEAIEKVTK